MATPERVRDQMEWIMLLRGPEAEQQMNSLVSLVPRINDKNLPLSMRVCVLGGVGGGQGGQSDVGTAGTGTANTVATRNPTSHYNRRSIHDGGCNERFRPSKQSAP